MKLKSMVLIKAVFSIQRPHFWRASFLVVELYDYMISSRAPGILKLSVESMFFKILRSSGEFPATIFIMFWLKSNSRGWFGE
jgi:hypothetical protein